MISRDAIELAITSPIDWEKFEALVSEVLQQDDLPRLRKLGGRGDLGIDAMQEAFYSSESRIDTVVQITSQKAQVDKLNATVSRLRAAEIAFQHLVIVYRQPVASQIRTEMLQEAGKLGISVDVRDQPYLITQLGHAGSTLFARYFAGIREQVDILLGLADPLAVTSDKLRHALLASLGAYVLSPRARLTRQTLFDKTVLAALVASGEVDLAQLSDSVAKLLPEQDIPLGRIQASLMSLRRSGDCEMGKGTYVASEKAVISVGHASAAAKNAFDMLRQHCLDGACKGQRVDDATRGYLERNLCRALLSLFRCYGPIDLDAHPGRLPEEIEHDLLKIMSKDVPAPVGRAALAALASYVEAAANWSSLAPFVRTYSTIAIRNIDPLGRRWQRNALRRSVIALDTDAVLYLLVEDLPEQPALLKAMRALVAEGFEVLVAESVLDEVVSHIARANKTYTRCEHGLLRMSPAMVDADVWHTVVRGFYYACHNDKADSWRSYWARYHHPGEPNRFIRFLLQNRIQCKITPCDEIPQEWLADVEVISAAVLRNKERQRMKAEFRDEDQMRARVVMDVRMAMNLAAYDDSVRDMNARGYLVSEDRSFVAMESHPNWSPRPCVVMPTHVIPELAQFVCGVRISDEDVVRLLFDPLIVAAAELISEEIGTLTSIGVDLRTVSVERLEWDLRGGFEEVIRGFAAGNRSDEGSNLRDTLRILREARVRGYDFDPRIKALSDSFEEVKQEALDEKSKRLLIEEIVRRLVESSAGSTKKARRRVNRTLREFGLSIEDLGSSTGPKRLK